MGVNGERGLLIERDNITARLEDAAFPSWPSPCAYVARGGHSTFALNSHDPERKLPSSHEVPTSLLRVLHAALQANSAPLQHSYQPLTPCTTLQATPTECCKP